jgi:hypothetical protein
VFLKPIMTAACLGSGAPGGLFTPTLTYGVLFGGLLGHGWNAIWPGAPDGSYAIIGGGAVLAASMQGPLAAVVMMIELARHTDALMVPLLLAVTGATVVARLLGAPSIYSARLGERAGAPEDGSAARDSSPAELRPEELLLEERAPGAPTTPAVHAAPAAARKAPAAEAAPAAERARLEDPGPADDPP